MKNFLKVCAAIGLAIFSCTAHSFFEDWRAGIGFETSAALSYDSAVSFQFESEYADFLDFLAVGFSVENTGNHLQQERTNAAFVIIGGTDERAGLRYKLTFHQANVDVETAQSKGSYGVFGIKADAELTIARLFPDWAYEVNVIAGGSLRYRIFDGILPQVGYEQKNLLSASLGLQFIRVIGMDEVRVVFEASETDAPNQYSGVPLGEICDVGFQSSATIRVQAQKQITSHFGVGAHIDALKDSCDEAWIPGAGFQIKISW